MKGAVLFSILVPFFLSAQGPYLDSLKQVLAHSKEDTAKVSTLNALASELAGNKPDSSLQLARAALSLSRKLHFEAGIALSLISVGQIQYNQSELDSALDNYSRSAALWEKLSESGPLSFANSASHARALGNIGNIYSIRADYPKALDYFNKALELDKKNGNKKGVARHLGNIGIVFKKRGDLPRALDYYLEALRLHEEIGNQSGIALWTGNIGILYSSLGDTARARKYLSDALKMDEKLGNKGGVERHMSNLGILYFKQGKRKEALAHYLEALAIAEEIRDRNFIGLQLGNIGVAYYEQGDLNKAMEYYKRALDIDRALGNQNYIAAMLGNIGGLYYHLKNYPESQRYLDEALKLSHELKTLEYTSEFELHYSRLDSVRGDFRGALAHYKDYIAARDSVSNEENTRKTVQLQMQYDFDKKQTADSIQNAARLKQEELRHEQEIHQQRIYTYGGALGFLLMLVVAGISFSAYRQKQRANAIITEQKLLAEEKQKEILDSIHYARRIQRSLLPSEKYIDRILKKKWYGTDPEK
jgi:tetratricopeptide (TPR) repeat protein